MIIYKDKDGEKVLDFIKCDKCDAICNKYGSVGVIHITMPINHPDLENLTEEDRIKGKDFCCHQCGIKFLEDCRQESFKLNMRRLIRESNDSN